MYFIAVPRSHHALLGAEVSEEDARVLGDRVRGTLAARPAAGGEGAVPKEMIRDEAGLYDVHVGWERDRYVQVGVETRDGRPLLEHLNEYLNDERRELANAGLGDPPTPFRGVWGTLDRAGCNRLIRALRRARDQAFGRDE